MGHFLQVAYRVLSEEGRPLSARQIADLGIQRLWLQTTGATPWQTMKSKLSTDILQKKESSLFMRTERGTFGLRTWGDATSEYVADRYQKALLDEQVVVFPESVLKRYICKPGLSAVTLADSRELIYECRSMLRRQAEDDFTVIQLVSVFIVHYRDLFLTYKRTKRLPESRLHGEYSMIFGGHLNPEDIPSLFNIFDPRDGAVFITRELAEEVKILPSEAPELSYRGLLYDDSRPLSRQHLGIVYDVALRSSNYEIGERGFLVDSRFESLSEISVRREEFENWSQIVLDCELQRMKG